MFDADRYLEEYSDAQKGKPAMRVLKKAIAEADREKDIEWQFLFRHKYIHESIFESDALDAIIIFPEFLKIFDSNYDKLKEYQRDLMWDFKYLINNCPDFYNIKTEQIDMLFDQFKERSEKYGYTLRAYKYLKEKNSVLSGNLLDKNEYDGFINEKEDDLKDCKACETSFRIESALLFSDEEKALRIAKPIISGDLHCRDVPEDTYAILIDYYIKKGNYSDAVVYAKRLYPLIKSRVDLFSELGVILSLYSVTDLYTGLNIFSRELVNWTKMHNHKVRFEFAVGAYRLFTAMGEDSAGLVLPKNFELYDEHCIYDSSKLAEYFYNQASAIAKAFDDRNHNSYYTDMLNFKLPEYTGENTSSIMHGYTDTMPSSVGAFTKTAKLDDMDMINEAINRAGYNIVLAKASEDGNNIKLKLTHDNESFDVIISMYPAFDWHELKQFQYLDEEAQKHLSEAQGYCTVTTVSDIKPDILLQTELKLITALCPDAPGIVIREKLLSAKWAIIQASGSQAPVTEYLYRLQIFEQENSDRIVIRTYGLNCAGMRELICFDATRENYSDYCDIMCFAAERTLIVGELPDSETAFSLMHSQDGTRLQFTWLCTDEAKDWYPDGVINEDNCDPSDAVLFMHKGLNEDGSSKLDKLGEIDPESLRYGTFFADDRKIAVYAKERFEYFRSAFNKYPENAYVLYADDEDDEQEWMKVESVESDQIKGKIENSEGETSEVSCSVSNIYDFSIRTEDAEITPDTVFLLEE